MSKYGLLVSQLGKDARSSDARNQAFNSDANVWKIHRQTSFLFTSNNQTKIYAHGLNYTPAFISFERGSGNAYYNWSQVSDYTDVSNLTLLGNNNDMRSVIILKDFGR